MAKPKCSKKTTQRVLYKTQKQQQMKKGGSAWQYTQSVYGSPGQQHPVGILPNGGTSNMIGINPPNFSQSGGTANTSPLNFSEYLHGGDSPSLNNSSYTKPPDDYKSDDTNRIVDVMNGGKITHKPYSIEGDVGTTYGNYRRRNGGNILSEIAVPATLLIANEMGKNSMMNRGYNGKTNKRRYNKYSKKSKKTFRLRGRR
jgi:hypothetical protein